MVMFKLQSDMGPSLFKVALELRGESTVCNGLQVTRAVAGVTLAFITNFRPTNPVYLGRHNL